MGEKEKELKMRERKQKLSQYSPDVENLLGDI